MQKLPSLQKIKRSIFIVDEKDLQNATTDVIKSPGINQSLTPVYTTTDTTESTSETQTSTPVHTTQKTSECHDDTIERNSTRRNSGEKAVESGERSTKDATTDSSRRKTSTRDDEDTIKRNDAGEKAVESRERSTKDKSTVSSIRKKFSRDDEDTIEGSDVGETTSRNVSIVKLV